MRLRNFIYVMILFMLTLFVPLPTQAQDDDAAVETISGIATVTDVSIRTAADADPPVVADVQGELPDSCSSVSDITQTVDGQTIRVQVETSRPADAFCAQVVQPFDIDVPLDVAGLQPGDYTVDVNGVQASLTLTEALTAPASSVPTQADCLAPTADTALFLNPQGGYCFLYPDEYNAEILEDDSVFVALPDVSANMGTSLMITAEPANDRTLASIGTQIQDNATDVRIEFDEITLGGAPAIVTDDLPARIPRRTAYTIFDGTLYTLVLQPLDGTFPDALAAAEALWQTITESFLFVNVVEDDADTDTLSSQSVDCPTETDDTRVFTGDLLCFRYPSDFSLLNGDDGQIILREFDAAENATGAGLVIQSAPSSLLSLTDLEQSVRATYPEAELTIETMPLGNVEALVTDDIPAEVSSQRLYVLWQGRLITMTLQPTDDTNPQATDAAARLWETVRESIVFLPAGSAAAQTTSIDEYEMTLQLPPEWNLVPAAEGYLVVRRDAPNETLLEIEAVTSMTLPDDFTLPDRVAVVASTVFRQYNTDNFAPQFEWVSGENNDTVIGVRFTNLPGFCRVTFYPHEQQLIRVGSDPQVCEDSRLLQRLDAALATIAFGS